MGEWKKYFVYTKRERQAVILLVTLTVSMLAIPHLFEPPLAPVSQGLKEPLITIDASDSSLTADRPTRMRSYTPVESRQSILFTFNPNTAGVDELMKLGISEKAATVIIHYREKGGRFKKPEDLARIYSIHKDLYERLRPFIKIPVEEKGLNNYPRRDSFTYKPAYSKIERSPHAIEINHAAQSDWESLPGIGAKLATRILTFRDKLGGFIKAEQVKETYGITDSVFDAIRPLLQCSSGSVRQIDLNATTIEELKEHPYFRGKIAYAIIRFREQHGSFKSMEDLKKVQVIDDALRVRIEPYLIIKNG
ncbi:MAG TPA: helix-hairpin-helix domain-containing protein [Flavitalea sp.]|nr:helix-hairpin-helix domain-containing protein [Flavitalea sp.]